MVFRGKKYKLRATGRTLLFALFALWVVVGIALAPGRAMPNMQLGDSSHKLEHHAPGHHASGHHAQPAAAPEPGSSPSHHTLRCVLCLVGAGTLPIAVEVVSHTTLVRTTTLDKLPCLDLQHFRYFRSRAPPLISA